MAAEISKRGTVDERFGFALSVDGLPLLEGRAAIVSERLHAPARARVEFVSHAPITGQAVERRSAHLELRGGLGGKAFAGVVTELTRTLETNDGLYRYCATLESRLSLLRYSTNSRTFQRQSIVETLEELLSRVGFSGDSIRRDLRETHPPVEFSAQWGETDLDYVLRSAGAAGISVTPRTYQGTEQGDEQVLLLDDSTKIEPDGEPLQVVSKEGLSDELPVVYDLELRRTVRSGATEHAAMDLAHPTQLVCGASQTGTRVEKTLTRFVAPGSFDADQADRSASRWLEALRSDASLLELSTNELRLSPGDAVRILDSEERTHLRVEGSYLVVASRIVQRPGVAPRARLTLIALNVRWRPAPKAAPQIPGALSAVVTGGPGEEIHVDSDSRVKVRFPWDRTSPTDHRSSLPVRVAQPNTPASMVFPRVGWEVLVAFEEGSPDRPYVLGRLYNGNQPPPMRLPENRAVTTLRSFSSPGGASHNTLELNDKKGGQVLRINAAFGKFVTVGGDATRRVDKVEKRFVGASQTIAVGGSQTISVKQKHDIGAASQTVSVGGTQKVDVIGTADISVGSESVSVGGALLEQVGSPAAGLGNLLAGMAVAGMGGARAQKWLGPLGAKLAGGAASAGWAMVQAARAPGAGPNAACDAGIRSLLGQVASTVPAGSAVLGGVEQAMGGKYPWEPAPKQGGADGAGGGAGGGRADSAGAAGGGAGHKNDNAGSAVTEIVGGGLAIITPGSSSWDVKGAATVAVGGAHATQAPSVSVNVLGGASESAAAHFVDASASGGRTVSGAASTVIAGALTMDAAGAATFSAGSISLKAGSLDLSGASVTFAVGGTKVIFTGGGMFVTAGTIKINRASKQSSPTAH